MPRKTPQEKKRDSYLKDRRNTYGENAKSSRKNIARRKRAPNRANRRGSKRTLAAAVGEPDTEHIDQVEATLKKRRPKSWKKSPDTALGEVLEVKLMRRVKLKMDAPEVLVVKAERIREHLLRDHQ